MHENLEKSSIEEIIRMYFSKEKFGHKLGSDCSKATAPLNTVKARITVRLFTGGKRLSLTVKTTEVNGKVTGEAAQVYMLKK